MKVSIVTVFAAAFVAVAGVSLVDAETATGRGRGGSQRVNLNELRAQYQRLMKTANTLDSINGQLGGINQPGMSDVHTGLGKTAAKMRSVARAIQRKIKEYEGKERGIPGGFQ